MRRQFEDGGLLASETIRFGKEILVACARRASHCGVSCRVRLPRRFGFGLHVGFLELLGVTMAVIGMFPLRGSRRQSSNARWELRWASSAPRNNIIIWFG